MRRVQNLRGDGGKGAKVIKGNLAVTSTTLEWHGCQHVLGKAQLTLWRRNETRITVLARTVEKNHLILSDGFEFVACSQLMRWLPKGWITKFSLT
jgi:hypothetical protein